MLDELCKLEELEKEYSFLSIIGIKILSPQKDYEIEGFIKAPENSPYKNGIFNFVLKYPKEYPMKSPELLLKTRIMHSEVHEENGHCCISLLYNWNESNDLSLILCALYELFTIQSPSRGYINNSATQLLRKSISEFEQRCQEYVEKYALKWFDEKLVYLFQGYSDGKKKYSDSEYIFVKIINRQSIILSYENDADIDIIYKLESMYGEHNPNWTYIIGNNAFRSKKLINFKVFLNYHIIFICPRLVNEMDHYL